MASTTFAAHPAGRNVHTDRSLLLPSQDLAPEPARFFSLLDRLLDRLEREPDPHRRRALGSRRTASSPRHAAGAPVPDGVDKVTAGAERAWIVSNAPSGNGSEVHTPCRRARADRRNRSTTRLRGTAVPGIEFGDRSDAAEGRLPAVAGIPSDAGPPRSGPRHTRSGSTLPRLSISLGLGKRWQAAAERAGEVAARHRRGLVPARRDRPRLDHELGLARLRTARAALPAPAPPV